MGDCTTVNTATAWYNGRNGKYNPSLNFDGTNDLVTTNKALSNFITAGEGTISVWIKPDAAGVTCPGAGQTWTCPAIIQDVVSEGNEAGYIGITQGNRGGTDRIWIANYDGTEDVIGVPYTPGQWIHIVWLHTGGTLYAYKDGVLVDSTASGNTASLTGTLTMGYAASQLPLVYFNGTLDDIRVYNYALTQAQIRTVYNESSAIRFGPLTGSP